MHEKHQTYKFPFRKKYPWNAEVWVELPPQLGREVRFIYLKGETTLEFDSIKNDLNRATLKLVDIRATLPEMTLVIGDPIHPDSFPKKSVHIPQLAIDSKAVDLEGSKGFVDLSTGNFSLQFKIRLTPQNLPLLREYAKIYEIDEIPVIVQEAGQLDLRKGNNLESRVRFIIDPSSRAIEVFNFGCGGSQSPEPRCTTSTALYASLSLSWAQKGSGEKTVYICPGDEVYLTWHSSADVTHAKISPDVGDVRPSDYTTVRPTTTTEYTIEAEGDCKRRSTVTVRVIRDGDTLDITAQPVVGTDYWEYVMTENCVSTSIKVTSIQVRCASGCTYIPALEMIFLQCNSYNCHGIWALWKEDTDGHLRSSDVSLLRVDLDNYPLAGKWRFWAYGFYPGYTDSYKVGGTANFRLWLKCEK